MRINSPTSFSMNVLQKWRTDAWKFRNSYALLKVIVIFQIRTHLFIIVLADFRQYDTMICPETGKVTRKDKWLGRVKEKVGAKKPQGEEILIPPSHVMRQICMEHFLISSRELFLEGNFYKSYDVSTATNGFVHLYNLCYNQKVFLSDEKFHYTVIPMGSLKEV